MKQGREKEIRVWGCDPTVGVFCTNFIHCKVRKLTAFGRWIGIPSETGSTIRCP